MSTKPSLVIQEQYGLFINGEFIPPSDNHYREAHSPIDGSFLAEFAEASQEDVDKAVEAAKTAFETFKSTSKKERAKLLNAIADVIDEYKDHLSLLETMDNGKPIRETANLDIPLAADHFRYFAGVILSEEGSINQLDATTLSIVQREPIGVVGQIIPWNFPFLMAAWKLAPALAAGDTVVMKPSSSTSLSLFELMRLCQDIIPAGVVNVVTGSGSKTGEYVLNHPDFVKLAFTGSTEVGYHVAEKAAEKLIPATLELGGKSANIFFEDVDLDKAMDSLLLGILFNQGQVCCAGSRAFVHESIYDTFVERATQAFKQVKVGPAWDPETQLGAQINENQCEKVLSYIELAKKEGATIAAGGNRITTDIFENGIYTEPTLITDVTNDMRVAQEEIFGPVLVVIPFSNEEEVIQFANDTEYGLGGGVHTKDISRAIRVAQALETGRVWINTYNSVPEGAPFGGYKKSGIGRETHKMTLDAYSQIKNMIIDISDEPSGFYNV